MSEGNFVYTYIYVNVNRLDMSSLRPICTALELEAVTEPRKQ